MKRLLGVVAVLSACGCSKAPSQVGVDCAQDRTCPAPLVCFPDFRCYPPGSDPACSPPCYGAEPFCDKATLRCLGCRSDTDCDAGAICAPNVQRCRPGCSAGRPGCPAPTRCDLALGVCRGCDADSACLDPAKPRCDLPTGLCVPCLPQRDDCPPGSYCTGAAGTFSCVQGCSATADCADAGPGVLLACCNRRCVDILLSAEHCGACGSACRNNDSCCSGLCVDLTKSADHCAGCGRSCYLPNVMGVRCLDSKCTNQGCESYFGDCDQDLFNNGCEVNLSYTASHCGSCANACSGAAHRLPACILTACGLGPCEAGWGDCDLASSNGCETPLSTLSNCGACNAACAANQLCDAGQCR